MYGKRRKKRRHDTPSLPGVVEKVRLEIKLGDGRHTRGEKIPHKSQSQMFIEGDGEFSKKLIKRRQKKVSGRQE